MNTRKGCHNLCRNGEVMVHGLLATGQVCIQDLGTLLTHVTNYMQHSLSCGAPPKGPSV